MGALHLVGVDDQLGLHVDLAALGRDQAVMAHAGVGVVGALLDQDLALEDAARLVTDHALDQLAGRAVGRDVVDDGGQVGVARAAEQIDCIDARICALGAVAQAGLLALQLGAGGDDGLAIAAAGRQPHLGLGDRNGVARFVGQDDARHLGVGGDVDLDLVVGDIGRALALMRLQQQQARARARHDAGRGGMARADSVGDEAQAQRLIARGDEVRHPDRTAVGEDDRLSAQAIERPRRAYGGRA
ncbi:hypothetical protein D3C80_1211980 [compost metagenome]